MDVQQIVTEQIQLGHAATGLLANPAFKAAVNEIAAECAREFTAKETSTEKLVVMRLQLVVLSTLVQRLEQMMDVGRSNEAVQAKKKGN